MESQVIAHAAVSDDAQRPDGGSNGGPSGTKAQANAASQKKVGHGQILLHRVQACRTKLEETLVRLAASDDKPSGRVSGIEEALAGLAGLLTADTSDIHPSTAAQLSRWLETSKYLADTELSSSEPAGERQGLLRQVEERRAELMSTLAHLKIALVDLHARADAFELSLCSLEWLLVEADAIRDHLPDSTVAELEAWLSSTATLRSDSSAAAAAACAAHAEPVQQAAVQS